MQLPQLKRGSDTPRKLLGREIAIVLAIKLLALYGLWYVFFSHPAIHGMTEGMDPDCVAAALVAPPTVTNNKH
jgi:hypothetical protein